MSADGYLGCAAAVRPRVAKAHAARPACGASVHGIADIREAPQCAAVAHGGTATSHMGTARRMARHALETSDRPAGAHTKSGACLTSL